MSLSRSCGASWIKASQMSSNGNRIDIISPRSLHSPPRHEERMEERNLIDQLLNLREIDDTSLVFKERDDFPRVIEQKEQPIENIIQKLNDSGIVITEENTNGVIITKINFPDEIDNPLLITNDYNQRKLKTNIDGVKSSPYLQRRYLAQSVVDKPKSNKLTPNKFCESVEWMIRQNNNYLVEDVILDEMGKFIDTVRYLFEFRENMTNSHITDTIMLCPHQPQSDVQQLSPKLMKKVRSHTLFPNSITDKDFEIPRHSPQAMVIWAIQNASKFVAPTSPLLAQLYFQLAQLYFKNGQVEESKKILIHAQQISIQVFTITSEEFAITCWLFSSILLELNDTAIAKEYQYLYYYLMGYIRFEDEKYDQSTHFLNQALLYTAKPKSHSLTIQNLFLLSKGYCKCNLYNEAIPYILKLQENFPQYLQNVANDSNEEISQDDTNSDPIGGSIEDIYRYLLKETLSEVGIAVIKQLLTNALTSANEFSSTISLFEEHVIALINLHGVCSIYVADGLLNLATVYERKSKRVDTKTPLCDLADAVRFNMAAAYIYDSLSKNSHECINIISRVSLMVHEENQSENRDKITERLNNILTVIPDAEYLLGNNLRYSFLCLTFPIEKRTAALNEKVISFFLLQMLRNCNLFSFRFLEHLLKKVL